MKKQIAEIQSDASRKIYGSIIARAWTDPAFRAALSADPGGTLAAQGVHMPEGTKVHVLHNTDKTFHLVIPPRPAAELDDEHLDNVAGGSTASTAGSAGTLGCPVSSASTAGSTGTAG